MSAFNRVPLATYRLQLNAEFPFEAALAQLDYLQRLGITYLYLSPVMAAREGSGHGYDVTDPTEINHELGGAAGFERLSRAARERGMGVLLDIVPNHMAADSANRWWMAALRDGPGSPAARLFDIYWDEHGKVLLPILGDHYANVLANDELDVVEHGGEPSLSYYDARLPISDAPESRAALEACRGAGEARRDALDRLVAAQHFRLGYWRTGAREINYRRFFDINELIALAIDSEDTFRLVHERLRPLVRAGLVTGVRIDHIDGLRDPLDYLERLRDYLRPADEARPLYVVVEKILTGEEPLPEGWPVAGTTGYDFLNMASAALTSTVGLQQLTELTGKHAAPVADFQATLYEAKLQVLDELFPADTDRLTGWLAAVARDDRYGRDLTTHELRGAIREVTAAMPVYRTYIAGPEIAKRDRELLASVISDAMERRPDLEVAIQFMGRVLLLTDFDRLDEGEQRRRLDFIAGWQQFTGPAMAKGLEDTTLYRDPTLISANAVGGERDAAEASVTDFHAWAARRAETWPHTLNATSTHDSKRSESVRHRIAVLSELPDEWEAAFERWREATASDVRSIDDQPAPDGRAALFIFQTLLGSWPLNDGELEDYRKRVKAYLVKAEREAKLRTSWVDQNEVYETALQSFINDTLDNEAFLEAFLPFQRQVAFHGMLNSLAGLLLKLTAPGVPDFYQGTEIWDLTLADPDNRRPVDFERHAALLAGLETAAVRDLLSHWQDGALKLFVTHRGLQTRARHCDLFRQGSYVPLEVRGARERHAIAFARTHEGQWAVTIVPRLTAILAREIGCQPPQLPLGPEAWSDTEVLLPSGAPGDWSETFTGSRVESGQRAIRLAGALAAFPIALLIGQR